MIKAERASDAQLAHCKITRNGACTTASYHGKEFNYDAIKECQFKEEKRIIYERKVIHYGEKENGNYDCI